MIISEVGAAVLQSLTKPFKWWVVIAEWEQGVRVRLGKNTTHLMPGIHLRIPWLDRVYVQSARLRTITVTGITCRTQDGKTAIISLATHFTVANMLQLYQRLSSPETTLEAMAIEQVISYVEQRSSGEIKANEISSSLSVDLEDCGLSDVSFAVTSFTCCRAFRLISNDYSTSSGMGSIDHDYGGERR